jgi:hypothetical protein
MLLPRYRTDTPPRRLHDHLAAIEHNHTQTAIEVQTLAPLDTIHRHKRGIPLIAQGISGTSPGTDPLNAALSNDRRRRYTRPNL